MFPGSSLYSLLIGHYPKMNNQPLPSIFQQLREGQLFFFKFSAFLLKLDFKDFSFGVVYKFSVQVLSFISMLLPLKILLFLSPKQQLVGIAAEIFEDKTQLILFLCVLLVFFMAASYLFVKLSSSISNKKLDKIVSLSTEELGKHKIKNIKNKIQICISNYSSFLLLVIFFTFLFFIYSELLLIAVLVSLFSLVLLFADDIYKFSIFEKMNESPKEVFNKITNFIFLTSFAFIVFDALNNEGSRSFIEMIIGLVLIRQASTMLGKLCISIVQLNKNKKVVLELLEASE